MRIEIMFINDTEIILQDIDLNQGKIFIKDPEMGKYDMFWGAMGGNIKEFIYGINDDYFCNKLLNLHSMYVFDVKKTFTNLRKFIREELDLPWYKHFEFQEDLRYWLNEFQENCIEYNSEKYFVDTFNYYICVLPDFMLINDRLERNRIENEFKNITEPWYFIEKKDSETTKWLKSIHKKIKNKLKKDVTF